jgi:hypothetical protein
MISLNVCIGIANKTHSVDFEIIVSLLTLIALEVVTKEHYQKREKQTLQK